VGRIDGQLAAVEPARGHVKLTRTNTGVLVDAELHSAIALDCSRCLVELTVPVDVRFSEEFQPVVDVDTGLPVPEPEDRAVFTIDESHELDMGEAFRQYVLLALPMAPLCDAACAGLCPQCGRNLNEGPCQCAPPTDVRWEALGDLLKDEQSANGKKARKGHKRR
jgi:uncharacterized protein